MFLSYLNDFWYSFCAVLREKLWSKMIFASFLFSPKFEFTLLRNSYQKRNHLCLSPLYCWPLVFLTNAAFKCFQLGDEDVSQNVEPAKWICPKQCGRNYRSKQSLMRHMRYECGVPRSFECHICGHMFALRENCRKHLLLKHRIMPKWRY